MDTDSLTPLDKRLKEIEAEISALERERKEVLGARDVVVRYMKPQEQNVDTNAQEKAKVVIKRRKSGGVPRPDGIPTIWEMTEEVLKISARNTLQIDEIVGEIERRWWPGVVKAQIAPTIYGFVKDGRLERPSTGEFRLIKKEEASDEQLGGKTSEASLFNTDPEAHGPKARPGGGT